MHDIWDFYFMASDICYGTWQEKRDVHAMNMTWLDVWEHIRAPKNACYDGQIYDVHDMPNSFFPFFFYDYACYHVWQIRKPKNGCYNGQMYDVHDMPNGFFPLFLGLCMLPCMTRMHVAT